MRSEGREHGRQHFEAEVFLVAQAIRPPLEDADFVVEALDEPERNLVFGLAVSGDSIPMTLDHFRELLVGLQALPLEAGLPILGELARPGFALVIPELPEGFLEQVGGIESLVCCQQGLQGLAAISGQVLPVAQQDVGVPLDVAPCLAGEPGVFALAHLVERVVQLAHHMELIEQNGSLRCAVVGGIAERFPHIHQREVDPLGLLWSEPVVERLHAGLRSILSAESDRPVNGSDR